MPGHAPRFRPGDAVALTAALALLALALLLFGGIRFGEPWAPAMLGSGAVVAAAAGLGAARRRPLVGLYGSLLALAAGLVAAGASIGRAEVVALGIVALVVAAALAPVAAGLAARSDAPAVARTTDDLLRRVHDVAMLSESAKRVLFRERELGLLRDAIGADIAASRYDAALALCDEMAGAFGHREEAERYRARVLEERHARYEGEAQRAMSELDRLLLLRDWPAAHETAARIRRLFGDSHHAEEIDRRVAQAHEEHKRELEAAFAEAAEAGEMERAMDLLRRLDRFLAPEEAERLRATAQEVVARHREGLGERFRSAVHERRWAEAARAGDAIVREFPNSRMADEVRSMIDVLRTRATQAAVDGPSR